MKKQFILLSSLMTGFAFAQVGINTELPKATLDVVSSPTDLTKTDGFIAPRLKGSELKAKDSNYAAPQIGTIVYITEALTTPNTTAKTVNVTTLGYFYFDGNIWQKMTGSSTGGTNPWNVENTTTSATLNAQNIYQNGNVGIGNFNSTNPIAKLDVRGALRSGNPHADELSGASIIGANSVALGMNNKATGDYSVAGGWNNTATGIASIAFGVGNSALANDSFASGSVNTIELGANNSFTSGYLSTVKANAWGSFISGQENTVYRGHGFAAGYLNNVLGNVGAAFGFQSTSSSPGEFVLGVNNAIKTGTPDDHILTDALFQAGNGYAGANNAITILKNAHTAIGVIGSEAAAKPTELLDLGGAATAGNGGLKIRNINSTAYTGATTDNIVVADASGVLKTISAASLSSTEPFQVESTTTKATTNTQNIYQNGNLGLGDFTATNPITKIDVRGSMRGGTPHSDELTGNSIGLNSLAYGVENRASGANSTAFGWRNNASGLRSQTIGAFNVASSESAMALGYQNEVTGEMSVAIGQNSKASGYYSTAMGQNAQSSNIFTTAIGLNAVASGLYAIALSTHTATANGDQSVAIGAYTTAAGNASTAMGRQTLAAGFVSTAIGERNAIRTGSLDSTPVQTDALFQVGNGNSYNPPYTFNNAMTVLRNGKTAIGVNGEEEDAKPTELLDLGGAQFAGRGGLRIRNINTTAYTGTTADRIVVATSTGVLKTVTTASLSAADFNFSTLPTYADDAAAGAGSLASGKLYKTATGEIRIKL